MEEKEYNLEKFYNYSLDLFAIQRMADGIVVSVNSAFERLLGWKNEKVVGLNPFHLVHPDDMGLFLKEFEELNAGTPNLSVQHRIQCADGSYKHFSWTAYPDIETGLIYSTGRDITGLVESNRKISQLASELKEANDRLFEQASTDPLTKLKNRRSFNKELKYWIEHLNSRESFLSLLMIDVDHFKAYNDQYGHPAGDLVLVDLASILTKIFRKDDVSARYGGEEFIVILPDTSKKEAVEMAETLVLTVREYAWKNKQITISVGATTVRFDKNTPIESSNFSAQLIKEADQALYHSKLNGRNQVSHAFDITNLNRS
ncbi:sensor domain-containing diguanylate cyclase [Leptospira alstonii]|uniref:diguanylate cyclase n=2 Tax=Leptospira alstonii TaxID=28452 RepID=M6CPJ3_9LEPT|nr:sensor domain-containing diguanylate cyclase [Leptospira alstonii]EMJ93862.1 diguanylate cyclase (GGDEF) domain protein [Leptospira alstonii serovar Sichuan str. 79601]EQA80354.1 diguanylate cyclase (GGDEF) domain protein [Leptospira alstonii serovar Pingchang str. 80-412]